VTDELPVSIDGDRTVGVVVRAVVEEERLVGDRDG
jgi:hypothetical protein